MPRPTKCRRVCQVPQFLEFQSAQGGSQSPILLTIDEYETIRLMDFEGLSQEQCSQRMQIARTTTQKIYDTARKKLALFLVSGSPLRVQGGAYRLCDGSDGPCGEQECYRAAIQTQYQTEKGEHIMKIAVTYENGEIFQHFGHTEFFKVYDVEGGKVLSAQVVSTNGHGHGALAEVLNALKADVLICGGIGGGAQMALASAGVRLYGGVSGSADAAVEAFLAGKLDFDPNVQCSHHGSHHHGEGHACGSHGCGSHSCGHH